MDKYPLQDRAKAFSLKVFKPLSDAEVNRRSETVVSQLVRSSTSVAANYRAARRAKSRADFINKLKIVEEEAEFLSEAGIIDPGLVNDLTKEANELVAIFTAALKTSRENKY